ncbi:MAG: hypothetical protein K6F48_05410 [Paludibacteraceae bacterium]|nr:hypothetical protein [Paludibacteraceae bacterium]
MELLTYLGGRLLGKKCIATILGLLGLCCPLSLWAEKLDTTFVLDMVIDTTPCYYTKYDNKGNIMSYGRHVFSDYFRINTGYVTNEKGERIDTLTYVCDKVTKQWNARAIYGSGDQVYFYSNGMLKTIKREAPTYISVVDHEDYVNFSSNGLPDEEVYSLHSHDGGANFSIQSTKTRYDTHGNILKRTSSSSSYHQGGSEWSNGKSSSEHSYKNEYDERGNLVASTLTYEYTYTDGDEDRYSSDYQGTSQTTTTTITKEEYLYDAENRRVKTVRYDFKNREFVLRDSTVYSYGHALHAGEACLLSISVNGNPVDSFSPDKYHYDLPNVGGGDLKYITPYGSAVEESYNDQTNTLSVTVKGSDGHVNTYTFTLKKVESFMTALRPDSILSIDFSPEKYQYDELENFYIYYFNFYQLDNRDNYFSIMSDDTLKNGEKSARIHFDVSKDARATYSYDTQNGIFTITVTGSDIIKNPGNKHTYTFKTKKIEKAYISSLRYDEKEFEGFSPDVYDYEMPADATLYKASDSYFEVETYPESLDIRKRYSSSTHTMYITLRTMYVYNGTADTVAVYQFHFKPDLHRVYDEKGNSFSKMLEEFSEDVFEYELAGKYYPGRLKYYKGDSMDDNINIDESFDEQTNTLTVSVSFKNDSTMVTNYRFHFPEGSEEIIPPSLYISANRDISMHSIHVDSTEFELIGFFYSDYCQYEVTDGIFMRKSYDESTNVWTIVVTDNFKVSETEYHIHFKHPFFSSLTIKGEPLETFSEDTYYYRFDMEYDSSTVSYELPDDVDATESFNNTTNTLTICLTPRKTHGTVEYKFHFHPVDGVDDFLGDQVSLYATDRTICIDGATAPIYVYNILGTLVGTGQGEEIRIPVPQAGVYVVRSGAKAAKVVVKRHIE